jgi:aminopeptidase-like protein
MTLAQANVSAGAVGIGDEIYALIERLYPICRSITGAGVRETLAIVGETVSLAISEVPTGTPVFDWTVPKEWTIRDAYVKDETGRRVIDFRAHNLHVVSYSAPVRTTVDLDELKRHLHSMSDRPRWIPYRTSYWKEDWGFCLAHDRLLDLRPGRYEVCVDADLADGSLTYGECLLPGRTTNEVLLFTHVCHPSLCNDNCSGIALATLLARELARRERRYSYRFVFAPGTIGSLTWLSRNEDTCTRIRHGLVLTGFGDPGPFTYKRSQRGDAAIDRIAEHVLTRPGRRADIVDFSPYGYDERQFCSPGFDLPLGRLSRQPYGSYPQYHTSADNLGFVSRTQLAEAFAVCLEIVDVIENDRRFVNTAPKGEPRLGKRGLFRPTGGTGVSRHEEAMLWILNQSNGDRSLLDIARRSNIDFAVIREASADLIACGLLVEAGS